MLIFWVETLVVSSPRILVRFRTTSGAIRMGCTSKDCRGSCTGASVSSWRMQSGLHCTPWHAAKQHPHHPWFWTTGMAISYTPT